MAAQAVFGQDKCDKVINAASLNIWGGNSTVFNSLFTHKVHTKMNEFRIKMANAAHACVG